MYLEVGRRKRKSRRKRMDMRKCKKVWINLRKGWRKIKRKSRKKCRRKHRIRRRMS